MVISGTHCTDFFLFFFFFTLFLLDLLAISLGATWTYFSCNHEMPSHCFPGGISVMYSARSEFSPGLPHAHLAIVSLPEPLQNSTQWSTGGNMGHKIQAVPTPNCLGSASLFLLMEGSNKPAGPTVLWLGSPSEFPVNFPSHLTASGVPWFSNK